MCLLWAETAMQRKVAAPVISWHSTIGALTNTQSQNNIISTPVWSWQFERQVSSILLGRSLLLRGSLAASLC